MSNGNTMQAFLSLFTPTADGVTASPGLIAGGGTGAVTQTATPSNSVLIQPAAWVVPGPAPTTQGAILWTPGTTQQTVALTPADATNPRYDLITVHVNSPGDASTAPDVQYSVVTGTPASSPVVPNVPTGDVFVRQVLRSAGDPNIVNARITGAPTVASLRTAGATSPLGYLATAAPAVDTTGITTTETNINNLGSVTATAGTGRRVEISADLGLFSTAANDEVRIRVYDGATAVIDKFLTLPNAVNRSTPFYAGTNLSGWSGAHTLRVTVARTQGSGTITVQAARSKGLLVKDIGT